MNIFKINNVLCLNKFNLIKYNHKNINKSKININQNNLNQINQNNLNQINQINQNNLNQINQINQINLINHIKKIKKNNLNQINKNNLNQINKNNQNIQINHNNQNIQINHNNLNKNIIANKFSNLVINKEKVYCEYNILHKYEFIKSENKINILIRTSNRPQYFNSCVNSILNQKYDNYHIFICYDKPQSLNYLKKYENNEKISYFSISIDSKEKYKFNLYNNILIDRVNNNEWIMFLDDDDMFTHEYVLKIINENIDSDNDLMIWKFMRPDKLIFPENIYNVKCGTIDTTCFCFNKKFLNGTKWNDKPGGDFYFFNNLVINNKFNRKFVNYILTKTIFEDKIASFGN